MVENKRLFTTALAVLGTLGASFLVSYRLRSKPLPTKPFIAKGVVRQYSSEGDAGPLQVSHTTCAGRADGSWVETKTIVSPNGEVGNMTTIWDAASAKQIMLDPFTKSAATYFYTASEIRSGIVEGTESWPGSCPSTVNSPAAEHAQMLGYDVVKVTEESPGLHGGKETMEAWVAPELGCYVLQRTESWSHGPHNEFQVTSVTEGEPPAEMFEVPPEYVERSPSQRGAEWQARYGTKAWGGNDDVVKRLDRWYHAHQRKSEDVPR